MRVVFRSLGHWEQAHDLQSWPDRDAVVELKTDQGDEFFRVSGVKWVLHGGDEPPCVVLDLVPDRFGRRL
jgi:hypothetical protein